MRPVNVSAVDCHNDADASRFPTVFPECGGEIDVDGGQWGTLNDVSFAVQHADKDASRFGAGLNVRTLIARSGGYTQQADRRRVFVVRADGAVVATAAGRGLAWSGAKRGWISTKTTTVPLEEGDTATAPPDLTFKPSKMVIAKDLTQILFQIAVAAATVIAIAPRQDPPDLIMHSSYLFYLATASS